MYEEHKDFRPPDFLTCPAFPELEAPAEVPELVAAEEPKELPASEESTLLAEPVLPPVLPPPPQAMSDKLQAHPKHRWFLWTILSVFVLLVAIASPLMYGMLRAGKAGLAVKRDLSLAQTRLSAKDFVGAEAAVDDTQAHLREMQSGLKAIGFWREVPYVRTQVRVLEDTFAAAQTLLAGVKEVVDAVGAVQEAINFAGKTDTLLDTGIAPHRSFRDLTVEEKRRVLARFYDVLPELHQARERFKIAREAVERIPQDQLYGPLRDRLVPFLTLLPQVEQRIDQAVTLMDVFLPMAGYPTKKNYLVLLQNSDELRATGGFIGNVGSVEVEAADIKNLAFQDVYAIDNPVSGVWKEVPPEPIARELGIKQWFLRDANWSPDFPQSAERMMDFYHRELSLASVAHEPVDGVIGLQPKFFKRLLTLTGPIVIDGKEFNAENFFDQLEFEVEIGFHQQGKPVEERKKIVAKVGDEIIRRLMDVPSSRWSELLDVFIFSLDQKDILIYLQDANTLALLDRHRWSGRTQPSAPDFLWVVDSNLAALKTDGVMEKEIRYSMNANAPGGPQATVTLVYHNTNRQITWRYTRYRDYVRVYVPEGSELISSSGAMKNDITKTGGRVVAGKVDVMRELGKTVFGAFWSIEPGETRELTFTYRLPPSVTEAIRSGEYGLYAQKQPGTEMRLTLDLLFGKTLKAAVPAEAKKDFGDQRYRFQGVLEKDRKIEIKL